MQKIGLSRGGLHCGSQFHVLVPTRMRQKRGIMNFEIEKHSDY